jgi:hypothetical protein
MYINPHAIDWKPKSLLSPLPLSAATPPLSGKIE